MNSYVTLIKLDYLQRTRSYAFLITLCITLAIAYTFVPEPNAIYSTISIGGYVGYYNSAWFGYVTAIMTSVNLSLIGFYLINSGIKTDFTTKVGQIVASTPISNFNYLFAKVASNFLILLTIVLTVLIMSILLFFWYNEGFSFELQQHILPYLLTAVPAMFIISVIAVVFEVFLGRYSVVQNILFFFLFSFMVGNTTLDTTSYAMDPLGSKIVLEQMEMQVREITKSNTKVGLNIGYSTRDVATEKKFTFNGIDFPSSFVLSRLIWMLLGLGCIAGSALVFHRFNLKERKFKRKAHTPMSKPLLLKEVNLSTLPKPQTNYGIFPLLKTEFLLLFRKGKKWLWVLNIGGMILLAVLPLKLAHQIVLPILWFLQVGRLSDLTTKESTNNVHYLSFASYKPISRLLVSQLMSAIILMLVLAFPLLVRLGLSFNLIGALTIALGGIFIVLFAAVLGILSKGKKLFEVLFFMVTYANINSIPFADYFGGFEHNQYYVIQLISLILLFGSISVLMRKRQLKV